MRRATVGLAIMVSGCASDSILRKPVVTFDSATAWSGNRVTARSADFVFLDSVPVFTVGTDTLTARYAGPGAVELVLPDTGGPITIQFHLRDGRNGPAGDIQVYGFAGWITGPAVAGRQHAWPADSSTFLVFTDSALSILDGRTGTAQSLVPLLAGSFCGNGPVPAVQPKLFVVTTLGSCGATLGPGASLLLAAGAPMDSVVPDTGPPATGWPALQLGRGRWLMSSKNYFSIYVRQPGGTFATVASQVLCGEPDGFAISRRGDRVIPTRCRYGDGGIPVFDPTVPQLAYKASALVGYNAATFSARGDTLFAAGYASDGSSVLQTIFILNATSGTLLAQAPMTNAVDLDGADIAADPDAPWLFVASGHNDSLQVYSAKPVVEVYDRRTLTLVASLRVPSGSGFPPSRYTDEFVLALNRSNRQLYVLVSNFFGGEPSRVAYYNLPP